MTFSLHPTRASGGMSLSLGTLLHQSSSSLRSTQSGPAETHIDHCAINGVSLLHVTLHEPVQVTLDSRASVTCNRLTPFPFCAAKSQIGWNGFIRSSSSTASFRLRMTGKTM